MGTKYKYIILANQIREQISTGYYSPGTKLPTENELCLRYGLSRQTIRQALSLLETEGLIEKRQGSGSFVTNFRSHPTNPNGYKTIAVITTYIGEYIFPDILRAIEEILTENHYLTMVFATKNRVDNERRILSNLLQQPLAGIIIEGTKSALPNPNIDLYREFEFRQIPIVFIHSSYPELTGAIRVVADDKGGGRIATEHLIANGHRRIACIFKSDDIQGHLRYAGYIAALRSYELPIIDDNALWYTTESRNLINIFGSNLIRNCTAVVCYNDEIALQLITLLKDSNIKVPQDISIMSFDNSTYSELSSPKISSCSQHKRQIGILSARKMINLINGKKEETSVLPWKVIEKESVRKLIDD